MNLNEFKYLIEEFKKRPIPGKRIFVWHGGRGALMQFLPSEITKCLDLAQLPISFTNLTDEIKCKKAIKEAIKNRLEEYSKDLDSLRKQQILVVLTPELIARYKVGLTVFYDYYIGDRTTVILLMPPPNQKVKVDWEFIEFNESQTLGYFESLVGKDNVIDGG